MAIFIVLFWKSADVLFDCYCCWRPHNSVWNQVFVWILCRAEVRNLTKKISRLFSSHSNVAVISSALRCWYYGLFGSYYNGGL